MIKKVAQKINWYNRIALAKLGLKRRYEINGADIEIDYTHRLPDYQKRHPFYDRFLPHFVKYLEDDSIVIDVGANVGDTLVGMVGSNENLQYICVEAADDFYNDLKKNADALKGKNGNLKISTVQQFVGMDIDDVSLTGKGGTKHAVIDGGSLKSKSLAAILGEMDVSKDKLSLLKTDVDGFDWDVIRSSYDLLGHHPYIFFECQYDTPNQVDSYKSMFVDLLERGYSGFAFFDNYGQYICSVGDMGDINDLLDYIKRQNFSSSTRTIYYYDVLVFSEDGRKTVAEVIEDYNRIAERRH